MPSENYFFLFLPLYHSRQSMIILLLIEICLGFSECWTSTKYLKNSLFTDSTIIFLSAPDKGLLLLDGSPGNNPFLVFRYEILQIWCSIKTIVIAWYTNHIPWYIKPLLLLEIIRFVQLHFFFIISFIL